MSAEEVRLEGVEEGSLADRATSGVLWSTAQKWAMRFGGLVTVAILARLLTPQEFGTVAVATAFVPIIYLLGDLGFSTYIVQTEHLSSRILSTAFWYAVVAGGGFGAVVIVASPLIAAGLGLPAASHVLMALAPSIMLVALSSVPIALLRRRLAFRALAIQSFVAGILGQVTAIALAVAGFGVWALVAQLLVNHLVIAILAWPLSGFRPSLQFSWRNFIVMVRFGVNVIAVEFVALARFWAETAIVTGALGATGLGYLNIAQRLIQATQDLSAAAVVPVSTVVFAQIRSSAERLTRGYLRASATLYILVVPIMVGVAVGAPRVIPLLFGSQWEPSVAPSQALAIAGIFTLGASLDNGLFFGTGKPGRWLAYAVLVDVLTVGTTLFAVRFGLFGIALGFVVVAVLATIARVFLVARLLSTSILGIAKSFAPSGLAACTSALAGMGAVRLTHALGDLPALLIVAPSILAVYIVTVRLLAPTQFSYTAGLIASRAPWRRTSAPEIPSQNDQVTRWDNMTP